MEALGKLLSIINIIAKAWQRYKLKQQIKKNIYAEELIKNEQNKKKARQAKKDRMANLRDMPIEQLRNVWESQSKANK